MCCSVDGPESPLGQDLTLIRPRNSPFTRLRITLEPSPPPKYKGILSLALGYGFGNCPGLQDPAPNCSCHWGGPESCPEPSLKPYLSSSLTPSSTFCILGPLLSRLQASSSCTAALADRSCLSGRVQDLLLWSTRLLTPPPPSFYGEFQSCHCSP